MKRLSGQKQANEANSRILETRQVKVEKAGPILLSACEDFVKGWTHFLNCIDFGKSWLDAEAIRFMNEVPGKIEQAVLAAKGD